MLPTLLHLRRLRGLVILCLLVCGVSQPRRADAQAPAEAGARRPNVLFIAVDDLRPELGCYGRTHIHSPNIDRLAASGMVFERAYVQQAVCAPSRASLLTGLRPDTTGILDLNTPLRKAMPKVVSLPQAFREAGYTSIGLGKIYHHPQDDMNVGWSREPWRPVGGQWLAPDNLALIERRKEASNAESKGRVRGPAYEAGDVPDDAYGDGQVAARAIDALRGFEASGEPFFLAVGFFKPHLPFNCPKRYWDLYDRDAIALAPNPQRPKNVPEQAHTTWGELRSYAGIPAQGSLDDDTARTLIHGYYACVSYTDAQVGRLLDALDTLQLTDNTIVILWGDHGWHLGDHDQWTKHTNFEKATHAPLILRAPGQRTGQRTAALVEFVDVYPTLCELAGVPMPENLEGTSVVPLLSDPGRPWKTGAFSQYPRGKGVMGRSLRTDRYRYTRWTDAQGTLLGHELYDHQVDPQEDHNLAADASHAATAAELAAQLEAGWRAARP